MEPSDPHPGACRPISSPPWRGRRRSSMLWYRPRYRAGGVVVGAVMKPGNPRATWTIRARAQRHPPPAPPAGSSPGSRNAASLAPARSPLPPSRAPTPTPRPGPGSTFGNGPRSRPGRRRVRDHHDEQLQRAQRTTPRRAPQEALEPMPPRGTPTHDRMAPRRRRHDRRQLPPRSRRGHRRHPRGGSAGPRPAGARLGRRPACAARAHGPMPIPADAFSVWACRRAPPSPPRHRGQRVAATQLSPGH